MLQKLTDKKSGWISIVILGLISITFAFFGVEQYFVGQVETFTARITAPGMWLGFGEQESELSQNEFRTRFEQYRQQQRQQLGDAYDARALEDPQIKRAVLDQMIDEELLRMAAQRDGITVSDAQVRQEILSIEAFQVNGKFDPNQYRLVLAAQNPPQTPASLDAQIRQDLVVQTMPGLIMSSAFVTDVDVDRFMRLSDQTRDLSLLRIASPATDAAPVSEKEIAAWYKSHAEQLRTPEQVSLEYIEIDAGKLDVASVVDESTLRARYDEQKNRFVSAEQRLASHILLTVPEGADAAALTAIQGKAVALVAKARAPGADFAALARDNSQDVGSKASGGDLGWVRPGMMVEPFEKALYALEPGAVSDPVRTEFGWHVITLREVKAGSQIPFEQARVELEQEYLEGERERMFSDLTGQLIDQVYRDPTALAPAAQALKLPLQTTPLFGRDGGPGIAANREVVRTAFSEALLVEGSTSDSIEITPDHIVVIRVAEHKPAESLPLDAVRDRIVADIRADRAGKAARKHADALLARAKGGDAFDALAAAAGNDVERAPAVTRMDTVLDPAIISLAFGLSRPTADKPSIGLVRLNAENFVLVAVTSVTDGDPGKLDATTRAALSKQYAQAVGAVEARSYLQDLRRQYKIEVAEDRM